MNSQSPAYHPCFVTFLDFLGFSAFVDNKTNLPSEINARLDKLDSAFRLDEDTELILGQSQLSFSDSIIRTAKLNTGKQVYDADLRQVLLSLIHGQIEMVFETKMLIRGAVSMGDVVATKSRVFGPAYQRAVRLESSVVGPFIAVDDEIIAKVHQGTLENPEHHASQFHNDIKELLFQSDNGLWLLDYLFVMQFELDEPSGYPQCLKKHRDICRDGLHLHRSNARVFEKYKRLSVYHNRTLGRLDPSVGINLDELKITDADILGLTGATKP